MQHASKYKVAMSHVKWLLRRTNIELRKKTSSDQ